LSGDRISNVQYVCFPKFILFPIRTLHWSKGHEDRIEAPHNLATWQATVNFAKFRDMAQKEFPNTPYEDLMSCIDFTRVPEEYSVKVIEPGASLGATADDKARFQALATEFRYSGGAIVRSMFPGGMRIDIMLTPMCGKPRILTSSGNDLLHLQTAMCSPVNLIMTFRARTLVCGTKSTGRGQDGSQNWACSSTSRNGENF
jgi:hypothetical protein